MDVKVEVAKLKDELITLRRDFHRHPELGFQEKRTSQIVETYLKDLGLQVRRCAGTGVIGVLTGNRPGKTVMLRCDIDALPVTEETGLSFASENPGVMHACGHDSHTAMLLVAAKILAQHRDEVNGTIVFLFQPNEEDAGAEEMVKQGALENPRPDAVFGLHIWSPIAVGKIGIIPGPIMASSYYFKITIHGRGGHGGAPHTAINPIVTAGHILSAIDSLHADELNSLKPSVISTCKIHSGVKEIIIPDELTMEGSIRCLHDNDDAVRSRFSALVEGICQAYRCTCDIKYVCGNTLLNNDNAMAKMVADTAAQVVGPENVQTKDVAVMLGDDFAEFSRRIPGAYFFLGTGNPQKHTDVEHHNCHFNIDEDSMPIGVAMHVTNALNYLNQ
ncbi:MAG: amidohydrolase [Caecibacter massiliensis]|nr:amidohydrolase [Caecibacter massiliensis]